VTKFCTWWSGLLWLNSSTDCTCCSFGHLQFGMSAVCRNVRTFRKKATMGYKHFWTWTCIFFRFGFSNGTVEQQLNDSSANQSKNQHEEQIQTLRRRELKWLHMLDHWDRYMLNQYKKVRQRCRKGIPASIRPRAWQHLCGAKYRMIREPEAFEQYVQEPGEQNWFLCFKLIKKYILRSNFRRSGVSLKFCECIYDRKLTKFATKNHIWWLKLPL
jgi:hypothetical protein